MLWISACASIQAQNQDQRQQTRRAENDEVIRVEVNLVPISVQVVDKEGNPVTGLGPQDFEILENGVPQPIHHFSPPSNTGLGRSADSPPQEVQPAEVIEGATAPEPPSSDQLSLVIVLGRGDHLFGATEELANFVRGRLGPQDQVAVVSYNRISRLLRNKGPVLEFLNSYYEKARGIEAKLENMQRSESMALALARYQSVCSLPPNIQDDVDKLFTVEGLGTTRRILPDIDLADVLRQDEERLLDYLRQAWPEPYLDDAPVGELQLVGNETSPVPRSPLDAAERDASSGRTFRATAIERGTARLSICGLSAAIEYLRYVSGEKMILFLNSGGLDIPTNKDGTFIRRASDANVRLFSIQTGGFGQNFDFFDLTLTGGLSAEELLGPGGPARLLKVFGSQVDDINSLNTLHELSDGTGGKAFISVRPEKALEKIGDQISATYLLGYIPADVEFEGEFRKISVKVKERDLQLKHRAGYYAFPPPSPDELDHQLTRRRTQAAARYPAPITDIPFEVEARIEESSDLMSRVRVRLYIVPQEVVYTLAQGKHQSELAIGYFFFAPSDPASKDGEQNMWSRWDKIDLDLRPEVYAKISREGLGFEKPIEVPASADDLTLRVVVYNPYHDLLGSSPLLKVE
ncbi:MAG TPA: VWA domain-containing protein [Acidobacteriota bacterium]|nr:VWA domain-containing protein [Acidobacteriota bacterium]